jgi:hypothetical protein
MPVSTEHLGDMPGTIQRSQILIGEGSSPSRYINSNERKNTAFCRRSPPLQSRDWPV